MNLLQSTYNLLFDQKTFFEEKRLGLAAPILLTLLYAVLACLAAIPTLMTMDMSAFGNVAGLESIMIVSTLIGSLIGIFFAWIVVALLFFLCLKFIGYAACSYKEVLAICGYVSGIMAVSAVLTGIIGFIGSPITLVSLLLSGVFLLWSVPVWYYGFKSICGDVVEKKLKTAVFVPVILMVLYTVIGSAGSLLAF